MYSLSCLVGFRFVGLLQVPKNSRIWKISIFPCFFPILSTNWMKLSIVHQGFPLETLQGSKTSKWCHWPILMMVASSLCSGAILFGGVNLNHPPSQRLQLSLPLNTFASSNKPNQTKQKMMFPSNKNPKDLYVVDAKKVYYNDPWHPSTGDSSLS